jgi:hypothetical protein
MHAVRRPTLFSRQRFFIALRTGAWPDVEEWT